jgi:hypothetical protein
MCACLMLGLARCHASPEGATNFSPKLHAPDLAHPPSCLCIRLILLQSLCPAILERFKEKNIVMSKAAEESLRMLALHCFTLLDVAEEVAAALDHKNPKGEPLACVALLCVALFLAGCSAIALPAVRSGAAGMCVL